MNRRSMVGMRVHVYSRYIRAYLGMGTIKKVEEYDIEDMGKTLYPSMIVLDSGGVTEGCKCWWMEAKE